MGVVGCGVDGLCCAHHLSRLGYEVDIVGAESNLEECLTFEGEGDLPSEVKDRELSGILSPSIRFKGNTGLKSRDQLSKLSADYEAVYVSIGFRMRTAENDSAHNAHAKAPKNIVFGATFCSQPEGCHRIPYAIGVGRKAASSLHNSLQQKTSS